MYIYIYTYMYTHTYIYIKALCKASGVGCVRGPRRKSEGFFRMPLFGFPGLAVISSRNAS